MDRRGRDEGVDAPALGRLDRLAGAVDVLLAGAREPAYDRVLGALGDLVDGGVVAFRGDRESGLDDVDAHGIEQLGDFELFLMRHGGAGRLLAVAQGGVENDDAILLGWCWRGHGKGPSGGSRWWFAPQGGAHGFRRSGQPPECPGTNAQSALRG